MINESRRNRRYIPDRVACILFHKLVDNEFALFVLSMLQLSLSKNQDLFMHYICPIICRERSLNRDPKAVEASRYLIPDYLLVKAPAVSCAEEICYQMGKWNYRPIRQFISYNNAAKTALFRNSVDLKKGFLHRVEVLLKRRIQISSVPSSVLNMLVVVNSIMVRRRGYGKWNRLRLQRDGTSPSVKNFGDRPSFYQNPISLRARTWIARIWLLPAM